MAEWNGKWKPTSYHDTLLSATTHLIWLMDNWITECFQCVISLHFSSFSPGPLHTWHSYGKLPISNSSTDGRRKPSVTWSSCGSESRPWNTLLTDTCGASVWTHTGNFFLLSHPAGLLSSVFWVFINVFIGHANSRQDDYCILIKQWIFSSPPNRQNTKDIHTLAQLISAYSLVDTDKAKSYPWTSCRKILHS